MANGPTAVRRGSPLHAAVAACALVAALAGCGTSDKPAAPSEFAIGAVFSTSGRGVTQGPQQVRGALLAVAELNRLHGGVDGVPLRLVVADDQTKPDVGAAQMRRLADDDGVVATVGPTLSLVAVTADRVADQVRTPLVAVSNTAAGLVGRCPYPCRWVWRASVGEAVTVPANVSAYVQQEHPSAAAIIHTDPDLLGTQQAELARDTFERLQVGIPADVRLPVSEKALAPYVEQALRSRPDALFIGSSFADELARIIHIARADGFTGAILGGNLLNSQTTIALAGAAGKGARSAAAWSRDNGFPGNADFVAAYRDAYKQDPDQFAAQAYAGILIIAQGLERAGLAKRDRPLAEQRQALEDALGNVAVTTPLGPFRFTAGHDTDQIVWVLEMDGAGGNRLVGFCNPECGG
ncbi:MAG: ABC-type branched-chain amino acid transport system, outer-rane component [Solirubrobacterales bacterium]|nr:ABC-type branched-chain amino acid transport system, outer-rane component [Solirubrobacterales bacterium]